MDRNRVRHPLHQAEEPGRCGAYPLLFVALIPFHSLMNMTSVAIAKRTSLWLTQLWVGVWGLGTLLLGLWACGKL